MSPIVLSMLLFVAATVAVLLATAWIVRISVSRMIGRTHKALEHIAETGQIPASWRKTKQGSDKTTKKLNKLAAYVRKTRLVDSEETRSYLLARLEAASSAARKE